jgi:hypothetical protein
MPTRRKTTIEQPLDLEVVRDEVDKWYALKRQVNLVTGKLEQGKNALKGLVQKYGIADPKTGSLFLDLEEPVGDSKIRRLKNQRSETTTVNDEEAEKILRRKGLWEEMTETITVVDQSRVFAAYYDNKITDDELARMFPKRVTFSFILLDEEDKPVH